MTPERDTQFIEWLAREVEQRGWSYSELARRAGLSSATISKLMSQTVLPSWDVCFRISRALQVRPEDVFRQAGLLRPLPEPAAREQEVLDLYRSLPRYTQGILRTILRALSDAPVPKETVDTASVTSLLPPTADPRLLATAVEIVAMWEQIQAVDRERASALAGMARLQAEIGLAASKPRVEARQPEYD